MTSKILYLFTRTPLHVGAGASVGAIDQPVIRERHTGFPIIPASSLKGSFADQWPVSGENGKRLQTKSEKVNGKDRVILESADESAWLFGSDTTDLSFAGSLLFSEAKLLAFPIRSAKGSYAWITCPLLLQRAARDGVITEEVPPEPQDHEALFKEDGPLALEGEVKGGNRQQIVLEDYCFSHTGKFPESLANSLPKLIPDEPLFASVKERLVILSNGMMSHFATTACEIAQHVRISDKTGTAEATGLFNQENVPADTLFYTLLRATKSRVPKDGGSPLAEKTDQDAIAAFGTKVKEIKLFQFGGDASTGLGFCTVAPAS